MNPHIQLFFDMIQECYGASGWMFDPKLGVQFTNSTSPNLHSKLLLGLGRDRAILDMRREVMSPWSSAMIWV